MSDFLLELRCEEIPARMQAGARAELEKLFRRELDASGVAVSDLTVWSTPRRLALIARGLPQATAAVSEEAKGPPVGAPDAAVEGFCRKLGITRDTLELRDVKGRETYFAVIDKPGRAMRDLLAEAIPAIVRDFSWPKSMRWGAASLSTESLRWVRPLSGIVAILGEDLVDCAIDGIRSGYATRGHRFHCRGASQGKVGTGFPDRDATIKEGEITIGSAADYQEKLRACHVIVDHEERAVLIREGAAQVAAEAGLVLVADEGLVIENAGLTEWPVPLLGRFDANYLDVPPEVIQLTARVNQKYFVCVGPPLQGEGDHAKHGGGVSPSADGDTIPSPAAPAPPPLAGEDRLANAFVCTANIDAMDPAVVVNGNRKVLAARLSDARFFWEQDRKVKLEDHAKKLERITFHEKLGTVADKVERVAKLARWLVEEGIVTPLPLAGGAGGGPVTAIESENEGVVVPTPNPSRQREGELADLAEQAARLCKADLVTEMVGEFPELQGLMGGYYARAEGLDPRVADAIRDHYKPVGQGDEVPTAPVTVAVSLADKLDTLVGFFVIKERPTGSKDPFALRRAALGIIELVIKNQLRLELDYAAARAGHLIARFNERRVGVEMNVAWVQEHLSEELYRAVPAFFVDRLKVQQREAGIRHDIIDAVFMLNVRKDEIVGNLNRVHALQAFIASDNGANLLAAYKRAANILKKEDWRGIEGEIASTGEEDPLALVDDPILRPVIEAKMAERHARELSYTPEPAEKALIDALDAAEPQAEQAIAAEDFAAAMAALASLRAPIDAFFEEVTVNDANKDKRAARLDLLARFRGAVHNVADFSRIEG
ncbi:MAG: glycine--tRNA ligase subunit beta [Erythrobacter sp.]|nr:MAG: glycine--tRNA ligase subunit beta [Erythrobacter sp.]